MGSFFMKNGVSYSSNADVCSPAYLYNQVKYTNCSGGSTYPANLNMMKNNGVCTLTEMLYNENDCSTQPNSTQHTSASKNKILKWELANKNDITNIKTLLYSGLPVMIAVNVDASFDNLQAPYIWKAKSGSVRGGHAITVTGYDNAKNAFKVQNSWGSNWKDGGYLWIDYDFFPSAVIGNECYVAYPASNPNPTDNITNGLLIYLPFENNTNDLSGNSNHGIAYGNSYAYTEGRKGKAIRFNNSNHVSYFDVNDYVKLPNSTFTDQMTVSHWVKFNSNAGYDGHPCTSYSLGHNTDGANSLFVHINSEPKLWITGNAGVSATAIKVNDGKWHHVTVVINKTNFKFYIDGYLYENKSIALNNYIGQTQDIALHRWYNGTASSSRFNGWVDEFRLYNRALTDSEVQKVYQQ
jgi:uncharacterized protein YvpB